MAFSTIWSFPNITRLLRRFRSDPADDFQLSLSSLALATFEAVGVLAAFFLCSPSRCHIHVVPFQTK
jgi:hypothetical protein